MAVSSIAQHGHDHLSRAELLRSLDGTSWRGHVDVLSAGFPCQPFSVAGRRLAGEDERDGWPDTARLIREVRPSIAWLENVPGLLAADGGRYFGRILGDLAEAGYDAVWRVLGAADVGAPHRRARLWIYAWQPVAYTDSQWKPQLQGHKPQSRGRSSNRTGALSDTNGERLERSRQPERAQSQHPLSSLSRGWDVEPDVGRVADGVASRRDRIKALGNGQCPQSMVAAFLTLRAVAMQGL